jgi:hypothetical protein
MVHPELDYDVPYRSLTWAWLAPAVAMIALGAWYYSLPVMIAFCAVTLLWISVYSTVLHYALDAEEFAKWPVVGAAFVRFQSHHFPQWINVIYRKPALDVVGELNPIAMINLLAPLLLFRMRSREVFVAWGTYMVLGGYAMLCHRWAHEPPSRRPKFAGLLQRAHLALNPKEHWRHHALAVSPKGEFVENYDLSFGWSNGWFNRVLRVLPNARVWLGFIVVATLTQVWGLAMLLRWSHR